MQGRYDVHDQSFQIGIRPARRRDTAWIRLISALIAALRGAADLEVHVHNPASHPPPIG